MALTRDRIVDWGVAGLLGTLARTVIGEDGTELIARSTAGITETSAGIYRAKIDPAWAGLIRWDDGQSGVGHFVEEGFDAVVAIPAPFAALWALAGRATSATSEDPSVFTISTIDDVHPEPGWQVVYANQMRRLVAYTRGIGSGVGTVDAPWAGGMEGGNPVLLIPDFGPATDASFQAKAKMTDATPAGLAKLVTIDTGETEPAAGSVAALAGAGGSSGATVNLRVEKTEIRRQSS